MRCFISHVPNYTVLINKKLPANKIIWYLVYKDEKFRWSNLRERASIITDETTLKNALSFIERNYPLNKSIYRPKINDI